MTRALRATALGGDREFAQRPVAIKEGSLQNDANAQESGDADLSPEQVLRTYFHAKDENRPLLLAEVFSPDAQLEVRNRSDQISFPATTIGMEGIADTLVRRFNQAYENIYSYYLDRPGSRDESFSCNWLVGMTDKESRSVRVGCGRYDWTFGSGPDALATRLIITIDAMTVLDAWRTASVMGWLRQLSYPWTAAAEVIRTLPLGELVAVSEYLGRGGMRTNRA